LKPHRQHRLVELHGERRRRYASHTVLQGRRVVERGEGVECATTGRVAEVTGAVEGDALRAEQFIGEECAVAEPRRGEVDVSRVGAKIGAATEDVRGRRWRRA
jgi:hypothetical protein